MSDNVEVNPFGDEVLQSSEGKVAALPGQTPFFGLRNFFLLPGVAAHFLFGFVIDILNQFTVLLF